MSSDRERIIEFDAATAIPADGWLAIDSTTEGTRKVQKSAIIGSGSLDTTSQEVIGAINEVNARAATVESMTQAEYDALPDTKLSDNVVRYITDGEPTYDETLWNKVGEDPLDTTAQDCSGAINELKSALSNYLPKAISGVGNLRLLGVTDVYPTFSGGNATLTTTDYVPLADLDKIIAIIPFAVGARMLAGLTSNRGQIAISAYGSTYSGNAIACNFIFILADS